ncbi:DUF6020 family protein [Kineothrix sedimenti]|uniref:DUF6020 family protein n=1 Tax=Kineothrix sedimenti TaxID=3123317 RepID=A0ABZ3EW40_9FIRM
MQKKKAIIVSLLLALAGTWCLPKMLNLKENSLAISNSFLSVFLWGGCAYALYRSFVNAGKKIDRKSAAAAGFLGLLFSCCIAFGVQLDYGENVNFKDSGMWIAIVIWTGILAIWIQCTWKTLEAWQKRRDRDKSEKKSVDRDSVWHKLYGKWNGLSERKRTALTMCLFFLCWLPVFLAVYPGFFVYDAQDEFIQVQTRNFTTHHPLFHVLLLGGTILGVNKLTDSYNMGIAAYTLLQMLFMSGVFTYVVSYMKKRGVAFLLRAGTFFYFAFFPVIVMFTLCSAKDGIFTAALLLLLLSMADMAREKESFFASWKKLLFFGSCAFVMMSFRHNGMYAFLVMAPVLLFYMKDVRRKLAFLLGGIFAVYFLAAAGLSALLSAQSAGKQEMLTVPLQQLSRAYEYDRESFTEEDLETLYEILPEEALRFYTAKVSDGVKIWFDNEAYAADPGKYMRLWAKIGMEHPFTYINAWFMTSYGLWYPDTVIDVYRGNEVFTFTYEDSSFFGYEVEQPGTRESKLPILNDWYRSMSLEVAQQKVPVLSMMFSAGFLFWVFAFTFGYTYYTRRYDLLIPFLMVLLVWLTAILGPTYLPRYVLILWFTLPAMVAVLVN